MPAHNKDAVQSHYFKGLKQAIDAGKTEYCGCPCDKSMLIAENSCGYCQRFNKPCTAGNVRQCPVAPQCPHCKRRGFCTGLGAKHSFCYM